MKSKAKLKIKLDSKCKYSKFIAAPDLDFRQKLIDSRAFFNDLYCNGFLETLYLGM